ncbi:hypothetical protein Tco_0082907, partial [Tanacetum coccineum]
APSGGVTGTTKEKISERATIEILTRPETTSIHEDIEITELHTPKGSKQTEPYWSSHNGCIQLRKQLEIALESGKLNHLMKDLRQRVERRQNRNPLAPKVINMVDVHSSKKKKRKDREAMESWMNTPISFPPIMTNDASDEPLIIEAEIEGYLVRRVYVDEGSSVEVMFEHCFENLPERVLGSDSSS